MNNVQKYNNFTASPLNEMSGESLYVTASAYCINKTVLFPRSTHADHNNEEVLTSLHR
jgi:hypothetical protein